jgi:hypothetical protein
MNGHPTLSEFKNLLLLQIYLDFVEDIRSGFHESEIDSILLSEQSRNLQHRALESLRNDGDVSRTFDEENSEDYYYISDRGIGSAEFLREHTPTIWARALAARTKSMQPDSESSHTIVPAADRTVTLSHNSEPYQEAVKSLEEVILEFRNDHHLDNELGREKGALLKALEAGRELLDDVTLNVRIATALIIEPLKRIALRYEQAVVGGLATAAIDFFVKFLGLG